MLVEDVLWLNMACRLYDFMPNFTLKNIMKFFAA